jgi:hypothetical protein
VTQEPVHVPQEPMGKRVVVLEDGRTLTYYTFPQKDEEPK